MPTSTFKCNLNAFSLYFFPGSPPPFSPSSCCYTVSVAIRSSTIRQTVCCRSPSPAWWDTACRPLYLWATTETPTPHPTRPPPASRRTTPTMGACSRVSTWAQAGMWSTNIAEWPGWLRSSMTQHLLPSPTTRQQALLKPSTWWMKDSFAPSATDRQVQHFDNFIWQALWQQGGRCDQNLVSQCEKFCIVVYIMRVGNQELLLILLIIFNHCQSMSMPLFHCCCFFNQKHTQMLPTKDSFGSIINLVN